MDPGERGQGVYLDVGNSPRREPHVHCKTRRCEHPQSQVRGGASTRSREHSPRSKTSHPPSPPGSAIPDRGIHAQVTLCTPSADSHRFGALLHGMSPFGDGRSPRAAARQGHGARARAGSPGPRGKGRVRDPKAASEEAIRCTSLMRRSRSHLIGGGTDCSRTTFADASGSNDVWPRRSVRASPRPMSRRAPPAGVRLLVSASPPAHRPRTARVL